MAATAHPTRREAVLQAQRVADRMFCLKLLTPGEARVFATSRLEAATFNTVDRISHRERSAVLASGTTFRVPEASTCGPS